jgi:hypothetical protein
MTCPTGDGHGEVGNSDQLTWETRGVQSENAWKMIGFRRGMSLEVGFFLENLQIE